MVKQHGDERIAASDFLNLLLHILYQKRGRFTCKPAEMQGSLDDYNAMFIPSTKYHRFRLQRKPNKRLARKDAKFKAETSSWIWSL